MDNDFPTISITASKTNVYESLPRDGATFVLTRVGDTNAGLDVLYHYDGTAVPFADYTDDNFTLVSFPPGSTSQTVTLRPLDDTEFEGNETAIIVLDGGGTYAVGTPGSASATFIDDERPPANVLFSEDFDVDSSGSWLAQFGANNNIYDATTIFSYDYGSIGLPPAPIPQAQLAAFSWQSTRTTTPRVVPPASTFTRWGSSSAAITRFVSTCT